MTAIVFHTNACTFIHSKETGIKFGGEHANHVHGTEWLS